MWKTLISPALALALLAGSTASGQPPANKPPKSEARDKDKDKSSLEDVLARALKDNPDIRVAESKLREAESELNRVRLQVVQKVVKYHHDLDSLNAAVKTAEARYKRFAGLAGQNVVAKEELDEAEAKLLDAKTKRAALEAELPYLLGKQTFQATFLQAVELTGSKDWYVLDPNLHLKAETTFRYAAPSGLQVDGVRKALDTPVRIEFKNVSLEEALKALEKLAPGVGFIVPTSLQGLNTKYSLHLDGQVPLAAALQALEDEAGLRFSVRDYGILVTTPEQLPRGAMSVHDFWKSKAVEASAPTTKP